MYFFKKNRLDNLILKILNYIMIRWSKLKAVSLGVPFQNNPVYVWILGPPLVAIIEK